MKYSMSLILLKLISIAAFCQNSASTNFDIVPDSIKANGFYAEIQINDSSHVKKEHSGMGVNTAGLHFGYDGKEKVIKFLMAAVKNEKAKGQQVYPHLTGHAWKFDWKPGETYSLFIATASDSASGSTLYSGYIYFPAEKKWKLLATQQVNDTAWIKQIWPTGNNNQDNTVTAGNRWLQRSNGSWKALDAQTAKPPLLRNMSNLDSAAQQQTEEDMLWARLPKDSVQYEEGVFYQSLKEGNGRLIRVTDTVTVYYKGWLFSDGSVFDQTKQKPATFPLERLIKGWQVGLSHCKVGGKTRMFITSGNAYGIRTRSANIPPNSILVFDVEVLDAKKK